MTIEDFKNIHAGSVFMNGVIENSQNGLFMTSNGGMLKWVAIKGFNDWAIYCHYDTYTYGYVATNGQKVIDKENIKRCVPCDDEMLELYRY